MSKLKPCPFCGGKAERIAVKHPYWHTQYAIRCSNGNCLIAPITPSYSTKGADARAWNRRKEGEQK